MISGVNGVGYSNPSFKGIVKVSRVMVDGRPSYYYKDFDSCGLQLKNILLKRSDTTTTAQRKEEFRQAYRNFDPDYTPPEFRVDGDTASMMAKVRTGKNTFIVSAGDASYIADAGANIGAKHNLELNSYGYNNIGAEDAARDAYIEAKEELPGKFLSRERLALGHPQVVLYAERNAKGKPILKGAMIKNDFEQTPYFSFVPQKKTVKKEDAAKVKTVQEQPKTPVKKEKIVPAQNNDSAKETKVQDEKRDFFSHLKTRSWEPAIVKPKKTHRKRKAENPNQLLLDI